MRDLENCFVNTGRAELARVTATLASRRLSGTAPVVADYEAKLRNFFKMPHALAMSSGTAAWHSILLAHKIAPGDEVILPPTAPVMSVLPVLAVGARPVFCDTNPSDYGLDVNDLIAKVTDRTRAVLQVPMWGYPTCSADAASVCRDNEIPYIEDASHCHGSAANGHLVGTQCDASFFSTQERKLVTTGEGGFILTSSGWLAKRLAEIRDFGKRQGVDPSRSPTEYGIEFGLNFRISAIGAALGMCQLETLADRIERRLTISRALAEGVGRVAPWLEEIEVCSGGRKNGYTFASMSRLEPDRTWDVQARMFGMGIVSDPYRFGGMLLYQMPLFASFASRCPNAEGLLRATITLPCHEGMDTADIERVVGALTVGPGGAQVRQ